MSRKRQLPVAKKEWAVESKPMIIGRGKATGKAEIKDTRKGKE